jgi:Flp pilus assembly protein TadD
MDDMNSHKTVPRRLSAFRPAACSAVLSVFAILLVGGCAGWDKSDVAGRQSPELRGAKDIDPAMRKRIALAAGGDADEEVLRDALKQEPANIDAAVRLAQTLLAQKRLDEALEVLDNASIAVPGDLRVMNAKGVILDNEGRHHEAQALYRHALATEPGNEMLRNNLSLSLALDGKTDNTNAGLQPGATELARSR